MLSNPQDAGENPILQFGTSRFLLAHADLFISQALADGEALGKVTLVQTTGSAESAKRIAALASGGSYPVRVRGLAAGKVVDEELQGRAIGKALFAGDDWPAVRHAALAARVIISNTGDRGFALDPLDNRESIADRAVAPRSFPAKIAALLLERSEASAPQPLSLFPCELIERNGTRLRELVIGRARDWGFPESFFAYLDTQCRFANSLVDRIVSEPIEPVGAVAEPYALWAIGEQEGLVLPCRHPAIVVTSDLQRFETLKLHILNLGHTYLADRWRSGGRPATETVREILSDAAIRTDLEAVWREEVLPVMAARGLGDAAVAYSTEVLDRFLNPFLVHRLSDIANNHPEKINRRIRPMVEAGRLLGLNQPHLAAMLEATA
ncbi:mannitol dehydrogenase family protein [Rhizobium sp. C4]|uniref:mannitol dehydrogenase family protein n=1 Tax=Rhizobium sp. C4 TaxID=1349800 RepID=UPI001E316573|nr:mannitol dehydrogenase family protein [Rhizobium sp. C4]MCD2172533.1 mannitol dehydrogenase family protein [Rhizobium sp. C4]